MTYEDDRTVTYPLQSNNGPIPRPPGSGKTRVVCVALPRKGRPIRVQGNSAAELIPTLKSCGLAWVNFTVDDIIREGTEIAVTLGFSDSLISSLTTGYYASFEDRESELGIMVPAVKVSGLDVKAYPLLILARKDLIVTIHSREIERLLQFSRYADSFLRKLPESMALLDKLNLMLVRILDENNTHNFDNLREIEEQGDSMGELLLDPTAPRLEIGRKIYSLKHALITYLNTLWRTMDVLHSLRYGDAQLVSDNPKVLAKIGLLVEDVNRQIALSEHMSQVLASGLEVLQALYNNQLQVLNNRMALTMTWLTILGTAVLVPNTLATVFGSMIGLDSDILMWYIVVLVLSTLNATYLAYWWVRRWVKLPTSPS
jgi:magnesium transporter